MSTQKRMIAFRPPDEVFEQIAEYQRIEHRPSASDAVTVLVMDALERWRLSKLPRAERASDYRPKDKS